MEHLTSKNEYKLQKKKYLDFKEQIQYGGEKKSKSKKKNNKFKRITVSHSKYKKITRQKEDQYRDIKNDINKRVPTSIKSMIGPKRLTTESDEAQKFYQKIDVSSGKYYIIICDLQIVLNIDSNELPLYPPLVREGASWTHLVYNILKSVDTYPQKIYQQNNLVYDIRNAAVDVTIGNKHLFVKMQDKTQDIVKIQDKLPNIKVDKMIIYLGNEIDKCVKEFKRATQ